VQEVPGARRAAKIACGNRANRCPYAAELTQQSANPQHDDRRQHIGEARPAEARARTHQYSIPSRRIAQYGADAAGFSAGLTPVNVRCAPKPVPSQMWLLTHNKHPAAEGILSCMTIELVLLAASVVLGIVHVIIVSHLQSWQRGYGWTASSREHSAAPLTGVAGRAERALRNYLETFPFFAAAILVVTVTNTPSWPTVWGAHFYFWGRIVYAILYMADLPLARVEHPDDRHLDECCRVILEVTVRIARADRQGNSGRLRLAR
jgi:uncharacterized MAPEG superfamily protein